MLIWRLSIARFALVFDGGYGLNNEGRWNSRGRSITYAATSPSLCVLEKLVHIEDVDLLPPLKMVKYNVPEDLLCEEVRLPDLPSAWIRDAAATRRRGDEWLQSAPAALMKVPSAVLPMLDSPDLNVLINHLHPDAQRIRIQSVEDFALDARLLG